VDRSWLLPGKAATAILPAALPWALPAAKVPTSPVRGIELSRVVVAIEEAGLVEEVQDGSEHVDGGAASEEGVEVAVVRDLQVAHAQLRLAGGEYLVAELVGVATAGCRCRR